MAEVNVKQRAILMVDGKKYDIKPSGNPHQKLPKAVVKALEDGDYIADEAVARVAQSGASGADLKKAQDDVARLAGENQKLAEDLKNAQDALDAANQEIARLKSPAKP